MKILPQIRHSVLIIGIIVSATVFFIKCIGDTATSKKTERQTSDIFNEYAGSASCSGCHKTIYNTHIHTEHYLASELAGESNILGSFENDNNKFVFDRYTNIAMEKRDSGFYQVEYVNGIEVKSARFDITVGSGRKGQSYLSWINDRLSQLPMTYFSPAGQWSNSPGYPASKVVFVRPITSRCLECHITYAKKIPGEGTPWESFDKNKIIYRIDCEKCHGPAKKHVEYQTKNPEIKEARFIVNPGNLSRQQNLDLCALCHQGGLKKTVPSFQFQAGDKLSDYFFVAPVSPDIVSIDVHGNQFGLLSLSKCFKMSQLTCSSCHNVHENENGKISVFSARCMNCHDRGHENECKMATSIGPAINKNCIDCHMPKEPSHAVAVFLQGSGTPAAALMRTHLIKVYPGETNKVLKELYKARKN